MRSRLATVVALLALAGGSGGTIALGSSTNGNGFHAGAATAEYTYGHKAKKHKKHARKKHHGVRGVSRVRLPTFTG